MVASLNTSPAPTLPALPHTVAAQPAPVVLPSPIVAEEHGGSPTAKFVNLSPLQQAQYHGYTLAQRVPWIVSHGLRGDDKVNFSDQMVLGKTVPYAMGGLSLIGMYLLAGRNPNPALQAAVGVGLYMAAQLGIPPLVQKAFALRTGIDLGQLYQTKPKAGEPLRLDEAFISTDWPRTDLIAKQPIANGFSYPQLREKLGVSPDLADPDAEVNKRLKALSGQQRVASLLIANATAAVGAGWVAKQPAWAKMNHLPSLLTRPEGGSLWSRLGTTAMGTLETAGQALAEALRPPKANAHPATKAGYALAVASQVAAWGYGAWLLAALPGQSPKPKPVAPQAMEAHA